MLVSIYDEDPDSADDHVDDLYIEEMIQPGEMIPEV